MRRQQPQQPPLNPRFRVQRRRRADVVPVRVTAPRGHGHDVPALGDVDKPGAAHVAAHGVGDVEVLAQLLGELARDVGDALEDAVAAHGAVDVFGDQLDFGVLDEAPWDEVAGGWGRGQWIVADGWGGG